MKAQTPQCLAATDIMSLKLMGNGLCGPIPTCIGDLTSLEFLCLQSNLIIGELPETFSQVPQVGESSSKINAFVSSKRHLRVTAVTAIAMKIWCSSYLICSNTDCMTTAH